MTKTRVKPKRWPHKWRATWSPTPTQSLIRWTRWQYPSQGKYLFWFCRRLGTQL